MSDYFGDIRLGDTIDIKFTTRQISGAPFTLAGSPVISAYPGNSTTQLTAGITLTVDFDGVTGYNNVRVVASGGNGYAAATNYDLCITTGTVNSVSVVGESIGSFSVEARSALMPATAARTLVVDAAGLADANAVKVGPTGSGIAQTARDIGASVLLSTGTGTGQLDFTSGIVKVDVTKWLTGTIPAVNVTGVPKVDITHLLGTAWLTPGTAGTPDVNAKLIGGTAQTGGDIYPKIDTEIADIQSRLPTALTANGNMKSSMVEILTTALTETAGLLAGGFKKFFNIASPAATMDHGILVDTVTTATTATNLTNAPTNGDLTAAMKTSVQTAADAAITANALVLEIEAETDDIQTRLPAALVGGRMDSSTGAMAANVVTAAAIAADAIGASELAADAVAEIQAGLSTYAGADTSGTTTLLARLTAARAGYLDTLNTGVLLSAASVQAVWDAATSALTTAGSIGKWILDKLDVVLSTRFATSGYTAPLDAAGTRVAMGLASANLDTQLSTIDDFLDTEIAAIKAKTDNLPADPADASDIAGAFSTVNSTLATIAGYVDTEVAAIKAKTDLIPASPTAVGDIPTAAAIATAVWAYAVEGSYTAVQYMRGFAAVLFGKSSGLATSNPKFRDTGDTKNRVDGTADADGNRSAVTLDLT